MRFPIADSPYGGAPGPEEIALDGWLEDSGPYLSLADSDPGRDEPEDE